MSVFSTELDKLMNAFDMSNEKLGELVGVNRTTVSRWRSGERSPKLEKLPEIAAVFNVDTRTFVGEGQKTSIETIYNQLEKPRQTKVYNFAEHQLEEQNRAKNDNKVIAFMPTRNHDVDVAGILTAGGGTYNDKSTIETVTVGNPPEQYDLAFKVSGDSMYPTFQDGEIVFVKETMEIYNGQIGAVEINQEAFIKKMYLEGNNLRLVSLNTDVDEDGNRLYPDFYANEKDDLYIIGRVII